MPCRLVLSTGKYTLSYAARMHGLRLVLSTADLITCVHIYSPRILYLSLEMTWNNLGWEWTPTVSVMLYLWCCIFGFYSFHCLHHFVLITHPQPPIQDDCEPIWAFPPLTAILLLWSHCSFNFLDGWTTLAATAHNYSATACFSNTVFIFIP